MFVCKTIRCEQWRPVPNEDSGCPERCTRLFVNDFLLSNCLECADWTENLFWPIACESCWSGMCGEQNVASVRRLADQLLWLPPTESELGGRYDFLSSPLPESFLMPTDFWLSIRETVSSLPDVSSFPVLTNRDLLTLWLEGIPSDCVSRNPETRLEAELRSKVIAADPMEWDEALHAVQTIEEALMRSPLDPVAGGLGQATDANAAITTLYFDSRGTPEWRAIATIGGQPVPVLAESWILFP